jgi:hypothetical protein
MKSLSWLLLLLAIAYIILLRAKMSAPCPTEHDTIFVIKREAALQHINGKIEKVRSAKKTTSSIVDTTVKDSITDESYKIHLSDDRIDGLGNLTLINGKPLDFKFDYSLKGFDTLRLSVPVKNPITDRNALYAGVFASTKLQAGVMLQYHDVKGYNVSTAYSFTDKSLMIGYTHRISLRNMFSKK